MKYVIFLIVLFVAAAAFTTYEARFLDPEGDPEFAVTKRMCIQDPSQYGRDIGDYVERLTACHKLARHDYYYVKATYYRGVVHQDFENWRASYADYSVALSLDPSFYLGWGVRGWMNTEKFGNHSEAIEDLTKAIDRNYEEVQPFYYYLRARATIRLLTQNSEQSYELTLLKSAHADYTRYLKHEESTVSKKHIAWIERQVARQGMTLPEDVQ